MAGGTAADTACALPAWVGTLARSSADPVSEMLAMVWGPRFDREHALALLARLPRADGTLVHAIHAFGERFDALSPSGQRALRQGILDIADNAPCRASC
jgi:hypothetical protein